MRIFTLIFMCTIASINTSLATESPVTIDKQQAGPITVGLRVFTCGHSFHATVIPALVAEIATSAGIKNHTIVGISMIGGSRAIRHFQMNAGKSELTEGKVDVLTLSCMEQPDDGISSYAKLGVEHNPDIRVTLQELWIPEDHWPFDASHRINQSLETFDASTIDALKKTHEPYFKVMEDYVSALNASFGKQIVFIVPDAQATLALREKIIAGTAPGLRKQSELFRDPWGHPKPVLGLLSAYCHFAVIYRRSPVGLPIPFVASEQGIQNQALNHLLQELAWDAVIHHPLSGVKEPAPFAREP